MTKKMIALTLCMAVTLCVINVDAVIINYNAYEQALNLIAYSVAIDLNNSLHYDEVFKQGLRIEVEKAEQYVSNAHRSNGTLRWDNNACVIYEMVKDSGRKIIIDPKNVKWFSSVLACKFETLVSPKKCLLINAPISNQ